MTSGMKGRHSWLSTLAAAVIATAPVTAAAQTFSVTSITPSTPDLANVVSAPTGDTVFTVTASTGAVTITSGSGVRLSSGSTRATVVVACGNQAACNSSDARIRVGSIGSPTGRARALTNFNVAAGTATIASGPTGTDPIDFQVGPIGRNLNKTFYVGANFPIAGDDSGLATGAAATGFYVYISIPANTPSTGLTSTAVASARRGISMTLNSNLAFGTIVRPASGSGVTAIDATTGVRTVSGAGAMGLSTPSPTRASYTAQGEGGQVFSISVPATFDLTRAGGGTLTVTTSATASGAQTLSSSLGSAGSFSFNVGGSFPIDSTTPTGDYAGSFGVTVQYN